MMSGRKRVRDLNGNIHDLAKGDRSPCRDAMEGVSGNAFHRDEVDLALAAYLIYGDDVRVVQGGRRFRFPPESQAMHIIVGARRQHLKATGRFRLSSMASYTHPMPPAPSGRCTR